MKGHEVINHIVRDEMPDIEKVREACHRQFASQEVRPTVKLRRLIPIAAAMALILAVSTTVFASVGGFDWFVQRFNPNFASVVEPVMVYSEDEGIRITVIGAQNFETMAVVYLSVQELTEENRLTEDMDWWPGLNLHIEGMSGSIDQNLLYFDEASSTAYLEVRITKSEELPTPLTLKIDRLSLYPQAVTGNWVLTASTGSPASQHIIAVAHEFFLCDVIAIKRMTLTPLGLSMYGTFGAPSSDKFMTPLVARHNVYVETPDGLIPLIAGGGGVSFSSPTLYNWDEEFSFICQGCLSSGDPGLLNNDVASTGRNPRDITVAEKMEMFTDIRVNVNWQAESPIDVASITAIIIDGIRISV
ncbi:MAG: hypothetical protein FWB91_14365 [Defluviitaleaceae bacterium]|nr:hypothetical protein [Defluviitaleaceae bacterium]